MELVGAAVNRSQEAANINFSLNGIQAGTLMSTGIGAGTYDDKGIIVGDTFTIGATQIDVSGGLNIEVTYQGPGNGLLDYVHITYQSPLEMQGQMIQFRSPQSLINATSTFRISNTNNNLMIWDVTDPQSAVIQEYQLQTDQAIFGANSQLLREYLAFENDEFPLPVGVFPIDPQRPSWNGRPGFVNSYP